MKTLDNTFTRTADYLDEAITRMEENIKKQTQRIKFLEDLKAQMIIDGGNV